MQHSLRIFALLNLPLHHLITPLMRAFIRDLPLRTLPITLFSHQAKQAFLNIQQFNQDALDFQ
ncbi:hypothetical protein H6F98_06230 [Microcoleus sp. FACHB-SPT15]|uniref:hypothetical protein n=1 Tax=Microcoleus sp. FACHB-SPT15 TaxID=2692830 RepID=UPI00177FCE48|nr:hypothetical protein [Microcoleus sp. FACHB-SPT15]MBD1805048.1 hypothetical protein [Microcoleus sp. FACHB-SPT15]